jgi:hypothetical protein
MTQSETHFRMWFDYNCVNIEYLKGKGSGVTFSAKTISDAFDLIKKHIQRAHGEEPSPFSVGKFYPHHDCGCGNFREEAGIHSADCCYSKPHPCKGCEASKRIIAAWERAFQTVIESFSMTEHGIRADFEEVGGLSPQ